MQRLHEVTIVNLDMDTVTLPDDLKDYQEVFRTPLKSMSSVIIPKEQRDSILPPLPTVPGRDLLKELHILIEIFVWSLDSTCFVASRVYEW